MKSQISFAEWLIDVEFINIMEAFAGNGRRLREDFDIDGGTSNNNHLNQLFGLPPGAVNWFNIFKEAAKRYGGMGQDRIYIATRIAGELITSMEGKKPDDRFYSSVTGILSLPDDQKLRQLKTFVTSAANDRARRIAEAESPIRKKKTTPMSKLSTNDADFVGSMPSTRNSEPETDSMGRQVATSQGEEDERIAAGKKAIIDEILNLAATANDVRAKKRYEIAARVAEKRMQNAHLGTTMSIDELMPMFPEVTSRSTMANILRIINSVAQQVLAGRHTGDVDDIEDAA